MIELKGIATPFHILCYILTDSVVCSIDFTHTLFHPALEVWCCELLRTKLSWRCQNKVKRMDAGDSKSIFNASIVNKWIENQMNIYRDRHTSKNLKSTFISNEPIGWHTHTTKSSQTKSQVNALVNNSLNSTKVFQVFCPTISEIQINKCSNRCYTATNKIINRTAIAHTHWLKLYQAIHTHYNWSHILHISE